MTRSRDEPWEDLGECTTPEDYPAACSVTASDLERLKEAYEDDDDPYGTYIDTPWPPRDDHGNVYEIWYTYEDLNDRGRLVDDDYNDYRPCSGNIEPLVVDDQFGACNAPLTKWRDRYPRIRYCGRVSNSYDEEYTYCPIHKGRENVQSAEEYLQSGVYVQSIDHLYEGISPWKKLVGWGTFESLMGESHFDFAPEYEPRELDFSEEPIVPDGTREDGTLPVEFGYPTDHGDRALCLYVAAMKTVQLVSVQPQVMAESDAAGMMEREAVVTVTDDGRTITDLEEHHLNLPMSRLVKDKPRLLEMGGVSTDPDASDNDGPEADEIVLEIEADTDSFDTENKGTDPNAFGEDLTAESEKILEHVED